MSDVLLNRHEFFGILLGKRSGEKKAWPYIYFKNIVIVKKHISSIFQSNSNTVIQKKVVFNDFDFFGGTPKTSKQYLAAASISCEISVFLSQSEAAIQKLSLKNKCFAKLYVFLFIFLKFRNRYLPRNTSQCLLLLFCIPPRSMEPSIKIKI